ncbi:hypothetical protein L873DRAFT_1808976 [Choiromyces venosus 120613-1]|uniref:Uncharacterized protein n=1 Tax=Choiromyces venosus 120613-1 TaxID=1336337 RepID=A0A3N4JHZ4_9PEZI|nr:hypothetical protein L873DRAFT_1808976 [Choiromyces venosus 120613-1]
MAAYNYAQDTGKYAWDTDDRGDMGMPVIGSLENAGNEDDTDPEASYDPGLIAAAAGPSYPIARTSPANRFSESQPPVLTTPLPPPPAKRPRGRAAPATPTAAPAAPTAPRPAEGSSLVKVLERINEEKAKQIEKLEAKIEKLEEKLEKLDDRNRRLQSQNRVLELQLMAGKDLTGRATGGGGGGNGGGKRKRGSSTDLALLSQLEQEDDDDGDGGGAL